MAMTRRQRVADQMAAAKKMPSGASTTTSQRHGNWRKRSLGRIFQSGSEMGNCSSKIAAGMRASGIHQDALTEQSTTPRDEDAKECEADHGDGNRGGSPEFDIVQFEIGIGMPAEEETIFNREARVVGGLADLHPALLDGSGNEVDGAESEAESGSGCGAKDRSPRTLKQRDGEGHSGEQVAGHHAERRIREPGTGDDQGEQCGRTVEGATPHGALRIAIPEDEQQKQRDPEPAGQFAECGSLVCGEHRVARKECCASGEGCGPVRQAPAAPACGLQARAGQERAGDRKLNALPWKERSRRRRRASR